MSCFCNSICFTSNIKSSWYNILFFTNILITISIVIFEISSITYQINIIDCSNYIMRCSFRESNICLFFTIWYILFKDLVFVTIWEFFSCMFEIIIFPINQKCCRDNYSNNHWRRWRGCSTCILSIWSINSS